MPFVPPYHSLCHCNVCCGLFHSESLEGGPTKAELLDLLQHCEVYGSSQMSSAISSRAPSPSPSLMSILYPGLKPVSGLESLSSTPLNTPKLGRHLSGLDIAGSNLFQPIRMPHSNSNSSMNVADQGDAVDHLVVAVPTLSSLATGDTPTHDTPTQHAPPRAEPHTEGDSIVQREENSVINVLAVSATASHSLQDCLETEQRKVLSREHTPVSQKEPLVENSTHQRSRSNEMDYMSVYTSRYKPVSAFRTTSDSTFRPLSVDSSAVCPLNGKPSACQASDDSAVTRSASSVAPGCSELTIRAEETGNNSPPVERESECESSPWLKELDSSIISEFFGSSERMEHYLRADEHLLKLNDH